MLSTVRSRLAAEGGFTLIELMVTILLSSFVLLGVMNLMNASGRAGARVTDKSEINQRMRIGLDRITRVLRTQVCPNSTEPPIISASDSSVTFYSDTNNTPTFRPRKVTISLSGTQIIQQTWVPTNTASPWTYPVTANQTRQLAEKVEVIPPGSPTKPFLSYYTWAAPNAPLAVPLNTSLTVNPRPPNSTTKVAKIQVGFRAKALSGRPAQTDQTSQVYARNVDLSGADSDGRGLQCGS